MGIQKEREEFEKFKAKQIGVDYEALKKDLDDCERRFPNNRYAGWNFKSDWELWQAAKSKAVPHILAARDVLAERDRQINQEHYSTEHDDEYTQNELLRAATCYSNHALALGWVHRSNLDPNTYQSEEAPDLWPWDLDFWKPKSPRHDLVRAAALLIAEIERIDRAQEQSHD